MIRGFSAGTIPVLLMLVSLAGSNLVTDSQVFGSDAARTGPCVLLKNDHVLFGSAYQRGEFVVIEKQDGSRLQIARAKVACWADSPRGLYRFRVDNRQTHGIKAHLQEARWCMRYQMPDLATKELQAAYRLDPYNQEAEHIAKQLRRASEKPRVESLDPVLPNAPSGTVRLASHEQPVDAQQGVDSHALQRFARHIQPLLLNRCAGCHSNESDRDWELQAPAFGSRPSARITTKNLTATLRYVDVKDPEKSELLARAIDGHAGKTLTLGTRAAKPTQSLQIWLRSIRGSGVSQSGGRQSLPTVIDAQAMPQARDAEDSTSGEAPSGPEEVTRLPTVSNPFDPEIFNRRFHRD